MTLLLPRLCSTHTVNQCIESMHRDSRDEVRSDLTRYELAGIRVAGDLSGLSRQLRELLCHQVMMLCESQQLLLRLLLQRRIYLVRMTIRCIGARRVLQSERLRGQLGRQKLQHRLLLERGLQLRLLLSGMLPA